MPFFVSLKPKLYPVLSLCIQLYLKPTLGINPLNLVAKTLHLGFYLNCILDPLYCMINSTSY